MIKYRMEFNWAWFKLESEIVWMRLNLNLIWKFHCCQFTATSHAFPHCRKMENVNPLFGQKSNSVWFLPRTFSLVCGIILYLLLCGWRQRVFHSFNLFRVFAWLIRQFVCHDHDWGIFLGIFSKKPLKLIYKLISECYVINPIRWIIILRLLSN